MDDAATSRLLTAIEQVRDEARDRDVLIKERFEHMERMAREREKHEDARFDRIEANARHLGTQLAENTKQLTELATAQVGTAKAASAAAEISARALAAASTSNDDARKMVEGAMSIYRGALTAAVTEAVQPIADRCESFESDLQKSNEAMGAIVDQLGISDQVKLGTTTKPGETPAQPVLAKLDRRGKYTTPALIANAIAGVAYAVIEILRALGHGH